MWIHVWVKGGGVVYWFMRMRQGSNGEDFTTELWDQELIGVMFGTWTIDDVSDGAGGIDESKITHEWLCQYLPDNEPTYKKSWSDSSHRFLIEMSAGDKVVVEFKGALHIATVTDEVTGDPDHTRRERKEHFKCRRIRHRKDFPLEKLPSSYRLISTTGRGAVQRINAYEPLVELLDLCDSPEEVTKACCEMSMEKVLGVLAPKQWEAICSEYLRDIEGVRPLLLAVGSTLKDIDIYGVNRDGRRVLAQCKNDAKTRNARSINDWIVGLAVGSEDKLYFFARGGVKGSINHSRCTVVDGNDILGWLRSQEEYERYVKCL
jgi:hypothetical protein